MARPVTRFSVVDKAVKLIRAVRSRRYQPLSGPTIIRTAFAIQAFGAAAIGLSDFAQGWQVGVDAVVTLLLVGAVLMQPKPDADHVRRARLRAGTLAIQLLALVFFLAGATDLKGFALAPTVLSVTVAAINAGLLLAGPRLTDSSTWFPELSRLLRGRPAQDLLLLVAVGVAGLMIAVPTAILTSSVSQWLHGVPSAADNPAIDALLKPANSGPFYDDPFSGAPRAEELSSDKPKIVFSVVGVSLADLIATIHLRVIVPHDVITAAKARGANDPIYALQIGGCVDAPCTGAGQIGLTASSFTERPSSFKQTFPAYETSLRLRFSTTSRNQYPEDKYWLWSDVALVKGAPASSDDNLDFAYEVNADVPGFEASWWKLYGVNEPGVASKRIGVVMTRPTFSQLYVYLAGLVPGVFTLIIVSMLFNTPKLTERELAPVYAALAAAVLTALPLRVILVPLGVQDEITRVDLLLLLQIGLLASVAAMRHVVSVWSKEDTSPPPAPPT